MRPDMDKLYRRYAPMVMRRCRFLLRNEEEAADAMQETFVRLMRVSSLRENECSSLIYVTATNVCFTRMRQNRKSVYQPLDEYFVFEEDHQETCEIRFFLKALFDAEKESTQTIALLHYGDGMSLKETASAVNMSVSGVRKRLRNLRKRALTLREREQ